MPPAAASWGCHNAMFKFRPVKTDVDTSADARPLSGRLLRRLLGYTRPYARTRNWLVLCVVIRSIQFPFLAWALGAAIEGPIRGGDYRGTLWAAGGFAALALATQFVLHFRSRLALQLGEWVIRDIRQALFDHLQSMTMGFFNRVKAGWIISRLTTDVEAMRLGVQESLFVAMVLGGQMAVSAMLAVVVLLVALAPFAYGLAGLVSR